MYIRRCTVPLNERKDYFLASAAVGFATISIGSSLNSAKTTAQFGPDCSALSEQDFCWCMASVTGASWEDCYCDSSLGTPEPTCTNSSSSMPCVTGDPIADCMCETGQNACLCGDAAACSSSSWSYPSTTSPSSPPPPAPAPPSPSPTPSAPSTFSAPAQDNSCWWCWW